MLVTSRSGKSVFAMLGPYPTWELAERKARNSRVVHYRVESAITSRRAARQPFATRRQQMPYRHWFVVLTVDGVESRHGPYPTRRTAERKSEQHHKNAPSAAVKLVYDHRAPRGHRARN